MKKLISLVAILGGGTLLVVLGFSRPVLAQSNGLAGVLVSANSPLALKVGTAGTFNVAIKNTGSVTWMNSGDNAVNLGTVKPVDHASRFAQSQWIGTNRPATMQEATVAPGEVAHFSFPAVATGSGRVTDYFGLVMERVAWSNITIPLTINVQPGIWKGTVVVQSVSSLELKSRETATVTVRLRNDGDVMWPASGAGAVKIAPVNPADRVGVLYNSSWLSKTRVVSAAADIPPGGEGDFVFMIQAPQKTGTVRADFGAVAEWTVWIPVKFTLVVKVVPAIWSAQLVNQSPSPVSISPGDTEAVWADYTNTGNTVWSGEGPNAVKLGTAQKLDRASLFYDPSWLSSNRTVAIQPATVNPGETGRFTFALKAPNKIGKYKEVFRLVVEGTAWLPGEVTWSISVDEELVLHDPIRVGLTSTTDPITVQGTTFVIRRGSDKGLVRKMPSGGSVTATAFNGGYTLSTGDQVNDYLRFIPQNGSVLTVQTTGIGSTYNIFRGIVEVRRSSLSGNVWVVDTLELEDYVKGVAEVPDGWSAEAQKAQMVAARTFAVKKIQAPRADIFDIYDDTRDQVYYGYSYESSRPSLTAAADATKGLIITYGGQPISAYFFSDSGGYTESVENVWGKGNPSQAIPYLKAVPDPYAKPLNWSATLTQDYLQTRFDDALGTPAGSDIITNIAVTDRFISGRAKTITFTLQSGKVVPLPFYSFDYLTNNNDIKSMKFDVQPTGDAARPDFVFTGQGWGHGVGLAQWGAYNMAMQGKNFSDILTYYYTGVTISSR